jgi:hypothetical protein
MRFKGFYSYSKILFFYLLTIPAFLMGQSDDILQTSKELSLVLDKSGVRKVEQVSDLMKEAGQLADRIVSLNDEKEIRSNLVLLRRKYESSSELMQDVYDKILENFYAKANRIFINKFDHARYYDQKVDGYYNAALQELFKGDSVKQANQSAVYYANAYNDYINVFINQLRAIRIYQDFPIEYPYDWDDFFKERQIMLAREGAKDPEQKKVIDEQAEESFSMIYYRVQIAAHNNPIPESQLTALYKGNMQIQSLYEGGWYKYTIGNFDRYDKALDLLRACMVKKAFIVAYDEKNVKQDIKKILNK